MKIIGVTGGIASGKSTVATTFSDLGIEIIDADVIARELTEINQPGYKAILEQFGAAFFEQNGVLNRKALRSFIFENEVQRNRLESILHPLIKTKMKLRFEQVISPYGIAVIPLLFETHCESWVNRILVVDVPMSMQLERICQRDGIEKALAEKMIAAQVSREFRLQHANDVIDNSGNLESLKQQVLAYHRKYEASS